MKCSLGISNFLKEISSLSHSIIFFTLISEEGFLISPWYSLEHCIQMGISFLFSFAFPFSSFSFPGGSVGKVSAYNAGDRGSIPGLGRSPREGNGNPLQYSCPPKEKGLKEIFRLDSVVAQMVKKMPAMRETWIPFLGWEDLLEKGMATHSSILENPRNREVWRATVHGVAKSQTRPSD